MKYKLITVLYLCVCASLVVRSDEEEEEGEGEGEGEGAYRKIISKKTKCCDMTFRRHLVSIIKLQILKVI